MKKTKLMLEIEERFGENLEDLLRRLYEKKNTDEIGEELGMYGSIICNWFKKCGIKIKNNSEAHLPSDFVMPTKEEMERMYVIDRMSPVKIGEKLGICSAKVRRILNEYNINIRKISESKLPADIVKPAKEELERMYLKEKMSTVEMSKYYKVAHVTIGRWLKEDGIEIRNKSGMYDNKEFRRKTVDELLEKTEKKSGQLFTSDFKIKKKDGISYMGVLFWYKRIYDCKEAVARDILVQDLYGIKNISAEEKLDKEKRQLEKLLEGYANEQNQTNAGS